MLEIFMRKKNSQMDTGTVYNILRAIAQKVLSLITFPAEGGAELKRTPSPRKGKVKSYYG